MVDAILYEQPLNERIRAFLRLEHLFGQALHFQNGRSVWDSHASVSALIEILTILDRSDIRSEIIKEIDRHVSGLSKLIDTPTVDPKRLQSVLEQLNTVLKKIQTLPNKLSTEIRDNDLLNMVRQRTVITGGTCGFDLPAYHYWLNQSIQTKNECITRWLTEILPLKTGIDLLLKLTRNSAFFEPQVAISGFYQRSLDSQNPCQLLRISIDANSATYPEVSGNKHRVNVRFLTYTEFGRPKQISHELPFEISCCVI